MRKAWSVVLLILGSILVYAGPLSAIVRSSAGRTPEWASVVALVLLGGGVLWSGARLWDRWRMPEGIVLLVLAVSAIGNALAARSLGAGKSGAQAEMYSRLTGLMPLVALVLAVVGVSLIVAERRRRGEAAPSA